MLIRYTLAWFGLMILAILNGASRDALYKQRLGELTAHQISTVTLLVVITVYLIFLLYRWPVSSDYQAWMIGFIWLSMTLAFEFIIGHFVFGSSWEKILHDYNIFAGRIWVLIPLWVLTAPYVITQFKTR